MHTGRCSRFAVVSALAAACSLTLLAPDASAQEPRERERERSRRDEDDSEYKPGWLWLDGEVGAASMGVSTLSVDRGARRVSLDESRLGGPMVGLGAGGRLWIFRLGPRGRAALFDDGSSYLSGGLELGIHVPIVFLEPHVDAGIGFGRLGDVRVPLEPDERVDTDGYYGRLGGGLNVKVNDVFSVGGNFSWEMFVMTPTDVSISEIRSIRDDVDAGEEDEAWEKGERAEGSSLGSVLSFTGVVNLRY